MTQGQVTVQGHCVARVQCHVHRYIGGLTDKVDRKAMAMGLGGVGTDEVQGRCRAQY